MTAPDAPHVLFVCTGNATRSLIAARLLEAERPHWTVASRGTMAYEGLPPSPRTRAALASVGAHERGHTSRQLRPADLDRATVVVCFERHHVRYIRRMHPEAADRSATLHRWVRDLPDDARPLSERVGAMGLADAELGAWEEVDDPAGGDVDTFIDCATQIADLMDRLVPRLGA